jgi:hypothetical protein
MNSTQSTDVQILLFLVIIVWRLVRKMREQPVKTDGQRWRLPLILTVIGGYETLSLARGAHPIKFDTADVTYLVAAGAVSVALGLLRGTTVRIFDRGGTLTQRYSVLTAFLWLATVAVRLGLDVTANRSFGVASAVTGASILMMFGLSLLGESAMVALRIGTVGAVGDAAGSRSGHGLPGHRLAPAALTGADTGRFWRRSSPGLGGPRPSRLPAASRPPAESAREPGPADWPAQGQGRSTRSATWQATAPR